MSDAQPRPRPPYSPSRRAGDWLLLAGQVPMRDGVLVEGDITAQLAQVLANIDALLAENGATRADVVKTTVYLADMADWAAMNGPYAEFFPEPRPVRTTVGAALTPGVLVEIEVWAWLGSDA